MPKPMAIYNRELGEKLCSLIAEGYSLKRIQQMDGMPNRTTVWRWLTTKDPVLDQFKKDYEQARLFSYQNMADEVLDIADDGSNDFSEELDEQGNVVKRFQNDHYQRSRLRVDTRKWLLAKCLPKMYGEKITQEVTGKDGAPLVTPVLKIAVGSDGQLKPAPEAVSGANDESE